MTTQSASQGIAFRRSALESIDPAVQPIPERPHVAFVWPTELCSIGCGHCSFGSRNLGSEEKRLLAKHPEVLVEWFAEAGGTRLVACGGGEPLDEPDFLVRSIAACARLGIQFEIYTSGLGPNGPATIRDQILSWNEAWKDRSNKDHRIHVRLSVDSFHEDRIGLDPVVTWIQSIERDAPDWSIGIRGLRVEGDESITRLAALVGGKLQPIKNGTSWMLLPSGRRMLVEQKGFVLEGRGRLRVLQKRGLRLNTTDDAMVKGLLVSGDPDVDLGRPLSVRLTVTHRRLDLEIHSDGVVHILESQAPDLRLSMLGHSWNEMKRCYYRDPLLHRIVESGLAGVAELILAARRAGVCPQSTVPFSVEKLANPEALGWVTAAAIVANSAKFTYPDSLRVAAGDFIATRR